MVLRCEDSLTEAEIDHWKSYYQIIDPDTFQSKFYPLSLLWTRSSESVENETKAVRSTSEQTWSPLRDTRLVRLEASTLSADHAL